VSQVTLARNKSLGDRIADFCRTEGAASGPTRWRGPETYCSAPFQAVKSEMSRTPLRKRICDGGLPYSMTYSLDFFFRRPVMAPK
jgi:hypothetical protein